MRLEMQSDAGLGPQHRHRLCIDLTGRVSEPCTRDNVRKVI